MTRTTGTRVLGLAGWSGAGKTTLLARLIPALRARGHSVSTLKHAHHDFDIDTPGKDSYRHREAGATEVLVASGKRWVLMRELGDTAEPSLGELLRRMGPVDFILIEGFRHGGHARLEVHRAGNGKPWLYPGDPGIRAVASDVAPPPDCGLPYALLDDADGIARLVMDLAVPLEGLIS